MIQSLVLPKEVLFTIFAVSVIISGIQLLIHDALVNSTTAMKGVSCEVQSFGVKKDTEKVQVKLLCGDTEAYTTQPDVIASVINNSGSLMCNLMRSGRAKCEPRLDTKQSDAQ